MESSALHADTDATRPHATARITEFRSRAASLRTLLRYVAATCSPDLTARVVALAATLSDEQIETLLELWRAIDDRAVALGVEQELATWQRILAHLPGLAPALEAIRAHVLEVEQPCAVCADDADE
ncbi:MAG TPA: hypothetical protein VIK95_11100 [Egibacteraceae bacterium]|nr:hypothetical protein [Chloroflexota bacterium]